MSDLQTQSADSRVVVFVDSRVEDAGQLIEQLPAGAEVVWLDPAQDGLAQMAAALGTQGDVAAVHVLAHGHCAGGDGCDDGRRDDTIAEFLEGLPKDA